MLFDLQTRGRRRAVKVIYTGLALLMGGGLILFGIGTGAGGGGLLDVFKGGGTSAKVQISAAQKQAQREVRLNPRSTQAWADLARAQYASAEYDSNQQAFTDAGRTQLRTAVRSWQRYLALNPKHADSTLARLMANAYAPAGLNQPSESASALEIVTQQEPSAASYGQLAQFSYLANEFRKGDLAAAKAVQLTPKAQKQIVKTQLTTVRRQALQQQVQQAVQQGGATTSKGAATTPKR